MENADIKAEYDYLWSERSNLNDTLQVIERFVVPYRGKFFEPLSNEHEVEWRYRDIYDSTAVLAAQSLAASMQGSLTSPAIKWFSMRFSNAELNQNTEAKAWLENAENEIFDAIQASNFNLEAAEFYLDLVSFGTAALAEEEISDDDGQYEAIEFSAIPIRECYFIEDVHGRVCRFYRRYQWTPEQIIKEFGEENVPEDIKQKAQSTQQDKLDVIFCVYKRDDKGDYDGSTKILAEDERPFGAKYILQTTAEMIGKKTGYYEMPTYVSRWRKVSGSRWGHSPAMVCLSDILTLNELTEVTLEALGKVVDPANLTTQRGLLSDLDLGRGGLTVVRDINNSIVPYESRARFDVGELKITNLPASINQAFHIDQLQLKESPAMTAAEVWVRYELMQRLLGPTLGRLQSDFLDPMLKRTFNILYRAGRLGEVPDIIKESVSEAAVEYTGPLPRAQKMDVVKAINEWVMGLAAIAEIFPDVMDTPDPDKIAARIAELSGVPADLRRGETEIKKLRANRQKAQAEAQAVAAMQQQGEAAEQIGKGAAALNESEVA